MANEQEILNSNFVVACQENDFKRAKQLLEKGADVNAMDEFTNRPALAEVVCNENKDILNLLIQNGADVNKRESSAGITPLMYAVMLHYSRLDCEKRKEIREPVYIQEAWQKGLNDIGDTYIEIDMGRQQLYYYVDGELVLDTPIVTGNVKRGRNTPAMVCYIYAKQKNRVLRGPGYASPVKFWMPVKGGIGIHDARWRDEFGGDIYLTDGSHGCINLPLEKAEHLYGLAEIGTPVVMFYD